MLHRRFSTSLKKYMDVVQKFTDTAPKLITSSGLYPEGEIPSVNKHKYSLSSNKKQALQLMIIDFRCFVDIEVNMQSSDHFNHAVQKILEPSQMALGLGKSCFYNWF